ncbi:MAG: hypothetical protein KTR31_02500 [Myxococcales bacterium]|nr:hypothetical protein [Myxococcales bacterium]
MVRTVDAKGFLHESLHDTHGRLVAVRQGRQAVGTTQSGAYAYDARGRLVRFEDGGGNAWSYTCDLGGRLRAVGCTRVSSNS